MLLAHYLLDYGTVDMEKGPSEEFSIGYKYWVQSSQDTKQAYLVFTRKNVVFIFHCYPYFDMKSLAKSMDDDIINRSAYITFGIESP
jgi:hypothetical protein